MSGLSLSAVRAARTTVALRDLRIAGGLMLGAAAVRPLVGSPGLPCPLRAVTGVPCPLCGGTRAVALAAGGDADFLSYGAVWVVVLLALVVAGVLVLLGRRPPVLRYPVASVAVAFAAAWAWALANSATITA